MFPVDEHGDIVDGSMVTAIVSNSLLHKYPGSTILYNLIVSKSVPELVNSLGGKPVRTRVGHSYIKAEMRHSMASLAVNTPAISISAITGSPIWA